MSAPRPALLLVIAALSAPSVLAQAPQPPQPSSPAGFLQGAYSTASVQARAARIVTGRQARDEAKELAAAQATFRDGQLRRIEALAKERNVSLPKELTREQAAIVENLAPLDLLAVSRRYAEFQQRALEQEVQAYEATAGFDDAAVRTFVADMLPQLKQQLQQARQVRGAVGP